MPRGNAQSRGGGSTSGAPHHADRKREMELACAKKEFEQVEIGNVIFAPTLGKNTVNKVIGFPYSTTTRSESHLHDQLVVGKDEEKKELLTVMLTSLGMIGRAGENDIWDRRAIQNIRKSDDEWGGPLKYLIPVEPNTLDKRGDEYGSASESTNGDARGVESVKRKRI